MAASWKFSLSLLLGGLATSASASAVSFAAGSFASGTRSKLRHKNIKKLQGKPLLTRAIELALKSQRRGEDWHIVVSTDSEHYARIARKA